MCNDDLSELWTSQRGKYINKKRNDIRSNCKNHKRNLNVECVIVNFWDVLN